MKKALAFFTLLKPIKSGISDYSEELIKELGQYYNITTYIDDYIPESKLTKIKNYREFRGKEDYIIYNMGNHKNHKFIYQMMKKHKGILILHDLNLFGFMVNLHKGIFHDLFFKYHILKNHGIKVLMQNISINIGYPKNKEKSYLKKVPEGNALLYGWYSEEKNKKFSFRWVKKRFAFQINKKKITSINIVLSTDRKLSIKFNANGIYYHAKLYSNSTQEISIPINKKDNVKIFAELKKSSFDKKINPGEARDLGVRVVGISYKTDNRKKTFDIFNTKNEELIRTESPSNKDELAERYPMFKEISDKSKGIIVHNKYMQSKISEKFPNKKIAIVPTGIKTKQIHTSKEKARMELGLNKFSFMLVSYGFVEKHKRITQTLKAFKEFLKYNNNSIYIICGGLSKYYNVQEIVASLGIEKNVLITGFVEEDVVEKIICASDICINLRFPTTGASSSSLLKLFSLGKPCIITDANEYKELPNNATWKIKPDENEIKNIASTLIHATKNHKTISEKSENALNYAKDNTWEKMAIEISEFIEEVYQ